MIRLLLASLLLMLTAGCANSSRPEQDIQEPVGADLSCSYFYFLWGSHAEYGHRFEEALEAYEKALICDPGTAYIEKKLPVLLIKLGRTEEAAEWLKKAIERNPDDTSQYLLLAHLSIQQKNREEAIRLYREVLEREPDNEGVLLRLGILHTQQEQYDKAEEVFRDLVTRNPELYLAHVYLARLLYMGGDADKAAAYYRDALELNWSIELIMEMITFSTELEEFEEVLKLYTLILEQDAGDERAALGRVQTLLNLGRDEQALEELRVLREQRGTYPQLDLAIAKILLRLDKTDQAEKILLDLVKEGDDGEAGYLLGLIAYQDGDLDRAVRHLQRIPAGSVDYAEGIYLMVRILRQQDQTDRALDALHQATSSPDGQHPLFYALLSSLYQEQGSDEKAMAALTAGTAAFPESDQLHFEHALLLERLGLHDEAMSVMAIVVELNPEHAEALNFIGYSWADRSIELELAYEYILKAVQLRPENGYIRDSLGWVQFRLGNLEEALKELLLALEFEPDDPHIYDHLGDVYRALDRVDDARASYLKGLEMFDDESKKASLQKKLDELPSP